MRLAGEIGTPRYARTLARIYPQLENISVDYAILEPATRRAAAPSVFVLPAEVGWSDIGSWAAVYELLARKAGENVSAGHFLALDAQGNFFWSPKKFVAAIGVRDLVVVETEDALLLCPRDRAQDVGKIVKWLEAEKLSSCFSRTGFECRTSDCRHGAEHPAGDALPHSIRFAYTSEP